MNKINEPDPITNTQARHKLARIAPVVLLVDVILAAIIWFMKEDIFHEQADYLGNMIAGALIIAGVFSFVILKPSFSTTGMISSSVVPDRQDTSAELALGIDTPWSAEPSPS